MAPPKSQSHLTAPHTRHQTHITYTQGGSSAAAAQPPALADLPRALRDATAVLDAPNGARVYVLGVSHVSAAACGQVKELISRVRPDAVVVELCKDRAGMLVDPETTAKAPDTWICTRVEFQGLPGSDGGKKKEEEDGDGDKKDGGESAADRAAAAEAWPRAAELAALLRTRIGRAVTTAEVEGDVAALEATGLFARVRPLCEPSRRGDAPMLAAVKADGDGAEQEQEARLALEYVAPLGCTRFIVEPRKLPAIKSMSVRLDSSLKGAAVPQEQLDAIAAEAVAACAAEPPRGALLAYLVARRKLIDAVEAAQGQHGGSSSSSGSEPSASSSSDGVIVDFSGVATGAAEAVVRARRPGDGDASFVSGLEASADGGGAGADGDGIERFRPVKRGVQLSPRMSLPAEAAARMNALKAAKRAAAAMTARSGSGSGGSGAAPAFRFWRPEEVPPADLGRPEPAPGPDTLAALLTGLYAGLQAKAGRAVGVAPGAAWRAAIEAATESGARLVVLGDRPATISQRRLADAMFPSTAARLAVGLAALVGGAAASHVPAVADLLAGADAVPGGLGAATLAAGAAVAAASLWPVVGPLAEVWRFSQLDGPAVEAAVALKGPIAADLDTPLVFWGEDALLRWPGAWRPLIEERDAYMARVAAAAATGAPTGAPAYVAGEAGGQLVWRYAMSAGAPLGSAPRGVGEGEYAPPQGGARAVVVVVGTAHVRGMCREWRAALERPGDVAEFVAEAKWDDDEEDGGDGKQ